MKPQSPRPLFAILLAVVALVSVFAVPRTSIADDRPKGSWEQMRNENGIVTWKREVPGSPLIALRGEAVVDQPLLLVGSVLVDTSRSTEWIDSLAESKILRKVSDSEYVTYSHVKTPPLLADREFVTDTKLEFDKATKTLYIRMHSVNDPAAPKTDYVRGDLMDSSFVLTSIEGGKKTKVTCEMHADPKGAIPAWITNMFQTGWPYNTLERLRKQANKSDIAIHPKLKEALEHEGFFN